MSNHRKFMRSIGVGIGAVLVLAVPILAMLLHGTSNTNTTNVKFTSVTATATPCPEGWSNAPSEIRQPCSVAEATKVAQEEQQHRLAVQTALAQRTPVANNFKPPVQWPEPESYKVIAPFPLDMQRGPWGDATSVWVYGGVPKDDYTDWEFFYIIVRPGNDGHSVIATGALSNEPSTQKYTHRWVSPRALGNLTITSIEKPAGWVDPALAPTPPAVFPEPVGIVHFTSSSGVSGTFNLATQQWTFTP